MSDEGWDGTERRQGAQTIEQVKTELGTVRAALYEVAEGMKTVAPRTEVRDLVERERRERSRLMGVIIVSLVVVLVVLFRVERIGATNKRGVDRIVSCTTPGERCFEEQLKRSGELVSDFLLSLNEGHHVIECYLSTLPEDRSPALLARCEQMAADETAQKREEVRKAAEEARRKAENGGMP